MNEYRLLLSERTTLQRFLKNIPDEDVLDRGSFEARLRHVESQIAAITKSNWGRMTEPSKTANMNNPVTRIKKFLVEHEKEMDDYGGTFSSGMKTYTVAPFIVKYLEEIIQLAKPLPEDDLN